MEPQIKMKLTSYRHTLTLLKKKKINSFTKDDGMDK